jgi:hypothetical protein
MMRSLSWFVLASMTLAAASCGSASRLYPVSGKVTYKGQPAAGAVVLLLRKSVNPLNEHTIMGIVERDGTFELVCGSLGKGAPSGEYDVLIRWREAVPAAKNQRQKPPDRLKGRYADPKRPLLHAVVKAEHTQLPTFELKD